MTGFPPNAERQGVRRPRIAAPLGSVLACLLVGLLTVPAGLEAGILASAQDDPAALSESMLDHSFDAIAAKREIQSALDAKDPDLAGSFLELAQERRVAVDPAVADQVRAAKDEAASAAHKVGSFARGFITGEPADMAGLAGTAVGDLFVFGDIRDAAREGTRLARGEPADKLILGLAGVGIAITAGTYATAGVGAPVRLGLSIAKAAREAVKAEKTAELFRLAGDVGRVQGKAGTLAALDGLKLAEGPRDMSRIAKLAEKYGNKTRAVLKLGGRAAIWLTMSTLNLFSWMLAAVTTLLGFCASCKRTTERATERWIARRKIRAARAQAALAAAA